MVSPLSNAPDLNALTQAATQSTGLHIVVVGAGAAGMMAAAEAARSGARVTLLEKNTKTGVKILMSGGTRCNITHDTDAKGITEAFGHAKRFLQPSIGKFGPSDVIAMFHELGVETKREETGKIFPVSNRAIDVRDALHRSMLDAGVRLELRCSVKDIRPLSDSRDQWSVSIDRDGHADELFADRVIVTSGGRSWPGCGTTGDGYEWLRALGHTIVETRPALVPLVGGTNVTQALSGLTLPDVNVSVFTPDHRSGKKPKVQRRSSWLFTHFGFSGPAAMDVSGVMTAYERIQDSVMRLDLVPDVCEVELRDILSNRSGEAGKRSVANLLQQWVPSRLALAICEESHPANANCKLAELPNKVGNLMIEKLKRWHLPVNGTRGFAKAEVTAGGVRLNEVDPRTMQSRLAKGLFIAGEILDVDGWIGGYNFQAAFSTGRAAGIAASQTDDA
ncbi:BaiN/RdsA family NAD(P)/FAD-dependent oxidoreductase [Rhodopirellula bahusiensis]|uniref:Aminoacetone oxidase family FAD-binding enzyme n=1 Tax=Rhodopirellula bahusiensis TaxID=2014065 RepID=A0A2G1W9H5_9BACT|nr:NAD(P)/FAD-dependent oxidoreductase [Rhodopirellula bahusiensis]PHQ35671.1 aminoacetone oxidase family FAD-binding enzyme [Rhodopirellula bahusiensis]